MRIAICDDEKNIRELIGNKVAKQYPEADIVFFQSGEELLLSDKHIDILFLDIQMSGRNGMETARELRKKDKSVILIFVTAVEEYVFQAFDVGAFNYIVKPIDDTKFVDVLCRAVDEWHSQDTNAREPEANYVMINNGGVPPLLCLCCLRSAPLARVVAAAAGSDRACHTARYTADTVSL